MDWYVESLGDVKEVDKYRTNDGACEDIVMNARFFRWLLQVEGF